MADEITGLPGLDCPIRLRRSARASRFTLRLAEPGAGAVLTLPDRVPSREAQAFLERHRGWLQDALARQGGAIPVVPGGRLPIDGRLVEIATGPGPRLSEDRLVLPGEAPGIRAAAFLKARARDRITPAAERYAAALGHRIARIAFRDTVSRWGSCSSRGTLSFSWRLAMAPPEVQDYVAAHEAAHLVEMSHAPRYWAVVARLMPDYAERRAWLKREGRSLHRYRFEP